MSTDYTPAEWLPTSHYWTGRGGHTPRWIILHGTAGGTSAEAIARYFQTDDPPTSAHYVVGLNGEVVQCVAEANSAWANGVVTQGHDSWWTSDINPNFLTFSIEHVKSDTGNNHQLTQAQKEASFQLIEHLCATHNIPRRAADANGGIAGHSSIDPINRSFCPGPYPWDELWAYLKQEETNVGVPQGWQDDGTTLSAPNGKVVTGGFRWYVLTHAWAADNLPLENEHLESVIDITNPQDGNGVVQHFRKTILVWQQSTQNIWELWSGSTSLAWQQRALTAEKSVNAQPPAASVTTARASGPLSAVTATATSAGMAAVAATASQAAVAAPAGYIPPIRANTTATVQRSQTSSRSLTAPAAPSSSDPVSQRIAGLEHQLQMLIEGLGSNPKTKTVVQTVEKELGKELGAAGQQLANPKTRRTLFSNPKSFVRWVLMIVGLLFSDVVAWAVSTFLHHSTSLPVPFLTLGTVLLSGVVFVGTFRAQIR